jgi:signal transduction histidine kinase
MMRSLSTRLALAFALIGLVSIGLAALFVRQFVTTQFDSFVVEQRQTEFVSRATSYYAANRSWEGVSFEALFGSQRRRGGSESDKTYVTFVLVDLQGRILVSPTQTEIGSNADPQRIASGSAVVVDGSTVGTVYLNGIPGLSAAEQRYLSQTDRALAAAALTAVVAAAILGLLLARVITRPVRDLTDATRRLGEGALGQQVPVRSRDELGVLATQFNRMSTDLAHATELRRRMTADIAHDLRTPLTVIAGYLEALRDETLRPTEARFAAMHNETQILLRLVDDLHTLSLADAGELTLRRAPTNAAELLERVAQIYRDAAAQAGVALHVDSEAALPDLLIDSEQISRALSNLVSNALRYTPAGGRVTLRAMRVAAGVALVVRDTGAGIAPEHVPNVFERFYRADSSRQQATGGSGLGLAIVRSLVVAHGGTASVTSTIGQGTTFLLTLPIAASER